MKLLKNVNKILIHCTATNDPRENTMKAIRNLHMLPKTTPVMWAGKVTEGKGFDEVAYHFLVLPKGTSEVGRDLKYQGAHCYGQNEESVSICVAGLDSFGLAQFRELFSLLDMLKDMFDLKDSDIYGHYHFSSKPCPNFMVNL